MLGRILVAAQSTWGSYSQMLQVCPPGIPPFDVSVVSEFEEHLGEKLNKPKANMDDFEEMQRKLEAVVTLTPSYAPIKSLETQFTEKFGPEFFRTLDPSDKSSEPVKAVKEVKKLDTLAKKIHEIDSSVLPLPPVSHNPSTDSLNTDDTSEIKEVLKDVNAEADTEVSTELKLEDILDFDINKHILNVQSILKSIKELEVMSRAELEAFAEEQNQLAIKAYSENRYTEQFGHQANQALAKLLLQPRPATIKQSTFDAWKAAGFTAGIEFIDLVRECNDIGSVEVLAGYSGHLTQFSKEWNENQIGFLRSAPKGSGDTTKHLARKMVIPFIYRGITELPAEQSAKFEAAMRAGSVEDMRALARELINIDYSLEHICGSVLFFEECLESDRSTRAVMAFREEMMVSTSRRGIEYRMEKLKANFGIEPKFGAALENKDASRFVAEFRECIAKGERERTDCGDIVRFYYSLYNHLSNLEVLSDSEEKKSTEIRKNVLDPAFNLFDAQLYLEEEDTPEFLAELNTKGFASFEDAVKEIGKLNFRQDNLELCKKLCLIEKYREYVRHSGDLAYIKDDFLKIENKVSSNRHSYAYYLVDQIAKELGEPLDLQRCSFDMATKKLHCSTLKLEETLVRIYTNKEATELLTQLIRNAVSLNSLPNALHIYSAISKAYLALDSVDINLYAEMNRSSYLL